MFYWCHQIDQKPNEIFVRISALASKERSNQKSNALKFLLYVPVRMPVRQYIAMYC